MANNKTNSKEAYQQLINWYPGHMAKGWREVSEKAQLAHLFIIVLDARAPLSTYNSQFDKLFPHKPRLFIISKSDLGDKKKYQLILKKFSHAEVLFVNLKKQQTRKEILEAIKKSLKKVLEKKLKEGFYKPKANLFVLGVPNSGKSTLINLLSGAKKTKIGNLPGITRSLQWIKVNNYNLLDTPGILWPKLERQDLAFKLLLIGAIKKEVVANDWLAYEAYRVLSEFYPQELKKIGLEAAQDKKAIFLQLRKLAQDKHFKKQHDEWDYDKTYNWFFEWTKNLKGVTYDGE